MPPANRTPIRARHARAEAETLVGGPARVLEPSPPAVVDEWFADDAVVGPGVAPVPTADTTWEKWVADHPEHAGWTADRWLAAYRRLPELPAETATTRLALHRLAAYVLSPARRRVNGKIALRWALGGVGTPFFAADEQIRIAGTALVRQRGNAAETEPITTLRAAAAFVLDDDPDFAWAAQFDVPPPAGDLDAPLPVDPTAAGFLTDWYGFAWSVLEVADLLIAGQTRVDFHAVLASFATRGWRRVLAEGGPTLNAQLGAAGLLDEICLTLSPHVVGGHAKRLLDGAASVTNSTSTSLCEQDGFLFLRYRTVRNA